MSFIEPNIPFRTMANSWITLTLPSVIWLFSALVAIGTLESTYSFGLIGILAWLVFLGGILGFFGKLLS